MNNISWSKKGPITSYFFRPKFLSNEKKSLNFEFNWLKSYEKICG